MNIDKKFVVDVREIDKNYNFEIYNASTIGNPKNNTILFLKKNSQELLEKLKDIKNSILIILEGLDAEKLKENNLVIYDQNPRLRYALLLTEILKKNKKEEKIFFKDGYYYGENVEIGEGVIIEPFVKIGNNVEIGALTTVCSGTIEVTQVHNYAKIDDHVHIAHNVIISKGVMVVAGSVIGGSTKIGENSWIGINSSVKNGIELGENITLGMSTIVVKSVGDNIILTNEQADTLENIVKFRRYKKKLLEEL